MKTSKELFENLTLPSKKWQHYFDIYDKHLNRFRGKNPVILEIGIDRGGSLELWHKMFENPTIYAVDANPEVNNIKFDFDVNIELGDQGDLNFWQRYIENKPKFDIIIDDGGHNMHQQINSLISLFPQLNLNGVYLVEDTHTSYVKAYGGGFQKQDSFIEIVKTFIDMINVEFIVDIDPPEHVAKTFFNLTNISFYNSVVVMEKTVRPKILPAEVNFAKTDS